MLKGVFLFELNVENVQTSAVDNLLESLKKISILVLSRAKYLYFVGA